MALRTARTRALDREIARLALPALGALVAEPLFLLTDTALIGHLGAVPLAGLGLAGTVLHTTIGLLVFLAYATTPIVARRLGAGDPTGAVRAGIDGLWLALGLGLLVALGGLVASAPLLALFGADAAVTAAATEYLLVSLVGIPAMLFVIAATGLLRGLQNTRTPLIVAGAGFAANGALNALFIYGLGWGLAGSAAGTVLAQWGMASVYAVIAVRAARASGASLRPGLGGVLRTALDGGWMLLRTISLRVAVLAPVVVAAGLGTAELGALQIAMTLTSTLAFALDALAIAGQAMVGHGLGSGDADRVRAVTRRLMVLGVGGGLLLGALLAAASPVLGAVFTSETTVLVLLPPLLLVLAAGTPIAGFAYVLDGVLIGAGDARYLALAGLVNVLVFLPLLALVSASGLGGGAALVALWSTFTFGYQGIRALTLGLRARSGRWMRLGA